MAIIQWYPGHIAKAERELKQQLKNVDVVLEVLDARIPLASQHPQVSQWVGNKPRLLVINRQDMIPESLHSEWMAWFQTQGYSPYLTDAQQGKGIKPLLKAAQKAGEAINEKRRSRGMRDRAVRAVVMGFPNVGKSALINRLVGRKVVRSARKAGVTRQLKWVRISQQIDLLDAPGVIPPKLEDQNAAIKLAICDDIGEAAYDLQNTAAELIELLKQFDDNEIFTQRYNLPVNNLTGYAYVAILAERRHHNDKERTARELLNDFRKGLMGTIPLELPPTLPTRI
ncbi:Ras superfamily GTP-binding protein YlqF [Halothece sp. PCC 7418]|uniref:ribosome biogenesis GTPase YlqF n=1 Tax=Halothece sp. (strain PCC 7418) TaxID=65093 RepID=UPI0002A07A81|nr:ribosome biogenesis GTPase YlqF [Halothece sp. PCC 7418]AFZ42386.1 Ras superfamily GTP-binding protein YlqF [Halothece sp. PCC 7418]